MAVLLISERVLMRLKTFGHCASAYSKNVTGFGHSYQMRHLVRLHVLQLLLNAVQLDKNPFKQFFLRHGVQALIQTVRKQTQRIQVGR